MKNPFSVLITLLWSVSGLFWSMLVYFGTFGASVKSALPTKTNSWDFLSGFVIPQILSYYRQRPKFPNATGYNKPQGRCRTPTHTHVQPRITKFWHWQIQWPQWTNQNRRRNLLAGSQSHNWWGIGVLGWSRGFGYHVFGGRFVKPLLLQTRRRWQGRRMMSMGVTGEC